MDIYAVIVNRDDTVRVVSVPVVKETPQFYMIEPSRRGLAWNDPEREIRTAFGYSNRVLKDRTSTSARAALETYMARRQRDKANAQAVIGQATKQIASANELLMKLPPDEHQASDARLTDSAKGTATGSATESSSSVDLISPSGRS